MAKEEVLYRPQFENVPFLWTNNASTSFFTHFYSINFIYTAYFAWNYFIFTSYMKYFWLWSITIVTGLASPLLHSFKGRHWTLVFVFCLVPYKDRRISVEIIDVNMSISLFGLFEIKLLRLSASHCGDLLISNQLGGNAIQLSCNNNTNNMATQQ